MDRAHLALVIALAVTGCSDSPLVAPPDAPPPPIDAGPALMISGTVADALVDAMGDPVAITGAKVCIDDHPEVACGNSGVDGDYAMEIPEAIQKLPQIAFVTTAPGHLGEVNHQREGGPGFSWTDPELRSDSEATAYLATDAGFAYPAATTGFVMVRVNGASAGMAGVTATISPSTTKGAVYDQVGDTPDPTLTSTSANGVILFGNVAPGPFTVTVSAPGKTCSVGELATSWPAASNQVSGIVVAGAVSDNLFIDCE